MWSVNSKGTISWSEEAKLELLKLIKSRPIVLSNEDSDRNKKTQAWQHIYIALTKSGMPNSTVDKVRNTWNRLSSSTKTAVQRSRRLKKSVDFTKVQLLCNEILDNLNGIPPLPRPIQIKQERRSAVEFDEMEDDETEDDEKFDPRRVMTPGQQTNQSSSKLNWRQDIPSSTGGNQTGHSSMDSSQTPAEDEYWKTMQRVADYDLKLKSLQHEFETERMSMDRALHTKNMVLIELKIREKQHVLNV